MFATMRRGPLRHQDTSTGARREARQARPALEGLERRLSLSGVSGGFVIINAAAVTAAPATAGGTPTQIIITEHMTGC